MIRSNVVLPIPLGPTIAILAPWGMLNDKLAKISTGSKDFPRLCVVTNDMKHDSLI
jgi:hypothetical protein